MSAATCEGFLADIIAHPGDDTPRLIYADWLDDHDEPERAEFIRVQCELAKPWERVGECWQCNCVRNRRQHTNGKCRCTERFKALRRRERELLKANFGSWTDFLPESLVTKQCASCVDQAPDWETNVVECRRCDCTGVVSDEDHVVFRRGFPAEITCTLADWCGVECYCATDSQFRASGMCKKCRDGRTGGHGPALVQAAPLEQVALSDCIPIVEAGVFHWILTLEQEPRRPHELPRCLFERLPHEGKGAIGASCERAEDATWHLSEASLLWARTQPV